MMIVITPVFLAGVAFLIVYLRLTMPRRPR